MKVQDLKKNKQIDLTNIEEHQYLAFLINNERYAIEVLQVKEIIKYGNITDIPFSQSYVTGVTNIRGNIIPIISLAKRFKIKQGEISKKTCILVINIKYEDENVEIGVVVDMVNQVFNIYPNDMEELPSLGTSISKKYIKKIGKVQNLFIPILDMDVVLDVQELSRPSKDKK